MQDDLRREIEELAARLARIELLLGIRRPDVPPAARPASPAPLVPPPAPPPQPPTPLPLDPDALLAPEPELVSAGEFEEAVAAPIGEDAQIAPAKAAAFERIFQAGATEEAPPRAATARKRPNESLELKIGMRWMAWAGAAVVVLAVGFFVKLAYDQGWFGRLPAEAKCALAAGFGALLIGGGEFVLRRIGRIAAVGLFAAGIGTLYLTAYAMSQYFGLVSETGSFWLLVVVALIGFAIALRGRMLTIGILSALGGYATPLLLQGAKAGPAGLPLFLTMLLAVSLGLSAFSPKPFRALRYVAMGAHALLASLWIMSDGADHCALALIFSGLWWAMVAGEAVFAARRGQSGIGNAVATLAATAWLVRAGIWLLDQSAGGKSEWVGSFTFAVAIAAGVIAYFIGGMDALRRRPQTAAKLGVSLFAQAGVLTALAIALHFEGFGETVGWLALGVASIEIGRRLPSRGVDSFGLIVCVLAFVRVIAVDPGDAALKPTLVRLGEVDVNYWSLLALIAIGSAILSGQRLRWTAAWRVAPVMLTLAAALMWLSVCAERCAGITATASWLVGAAALVLAEQRGRRQAYLEVALLLLLLCTGRWLVFDAIAHVGSGAGLPFLNAQMAVALAIAATGWWAARRLARRSIAAPPDDIVLAPMMNTAVWSALLVCTCLFVLVAMSFEVDRLASGLRAAGRLGGWGFEQLRALLLTELWAVGAAGMGLIAVIFKPPGSETGAKRDVLLGFAWAILVICGAKWLLLDTVSFLAMEHARVAAHWPVLNLQVMVMLTIVTALLALVRFTARAGAASAKLQTMARGMPAAACVFVLIGLSFELDRMLVRLEANGAPAWLQIWPGEQTRGLLGLVLWASGATAMFVAGRRLARRELVRTGCFILLLAGGAWLTFGTLLPRAERLVAATPILNLQFVAGAVVGAWLWLTARLADKTNAGDLKERAARDLRGFVNAARAMVGIIGLWLGSLEIDRLCAPEAQRFANGAMVRQMGLSIYWGIYGIGLVALGFWRWVRGLRYAGLALLAITLLKVLIVDMAEVRYVYRVLSLLGVGGLLMLTSIAYAKLSSKLQAKVTPAEDG